LPVLATEAPATIETPAFIVRSYPPFRMARIFRVYVDRDALYLIRMRGLVGHADAGSQNLKKSKSEPKLSTALPSPA
jgi:hypothetical protein